MNPDERLAEIVGALGGVGLSCLVMGGHAIRYYGVQRTTVDFDLHLAPSAWSDLPSSLSAANLTFQGTVVEGNSWRPESFRRFRIGTLLGGREEWLEFWRGNHLLDSFVELQLRQEIGEYGGSTLPFLGLPDLIRSKETERASDWQDIHLLEEIFDNRNLAAAKDGRLPIETALARLRSRVGLERAMQDALLAEKSIVAAAIAQSKSPITQALLLPVAPDSELSRVVPAIESVVLSRLKTERGGSLLHLALVEAVRRQYRLWAQAKDRADKERIARKT